MNKREERLQGFIALLVICAVAGWIAWANEIANYEPETPAAVRAAIEASYGEIPKPEGHGR